jgi:hypothetical protein
LFTASEAQRHKIVNDHRKRLAAHIRDLTQSLELGCGDEGHDTMGPHAA